MRGLFSADLRWTSLGHTDSAGVDPICLLLGPAVDDPRVAISPHWFVRAIRPPPPAIHLCCSSSLHRFSTGATSAWLGFTGRAERGGEGRVLLLSPPYSVVWIVVVAVEAVGHLPRFAICTRCVRERLRGMKSGSPREGAVTSTRS